MKSGYFEDSIDFMAHYIYAHLDTLNDVEKPAELFVGSIGGASAGESKTFYPRSAFEEKTIEEIKNKLIEIFPKEEINPFTDYNAFFDQVSQYVNNHSLLMRPISVVIISDGIPDVNTEEVTDFAQLNLKPLERLARNVTVRLIYTTAEIGNDWQTKVKRQRVRIWTQDAKVMVSWKDTAILKPDTPWEKQTKFFQWIKDNVDFPVRAQRVH
jgi:hypothetical protein